MSPGDRDFERFSGRLDEEWNRERLRALTPMPISATDEAALLRALEVADPLGGMSGRGWLAAIRDALAFWPGRLALAGVACALLVIGVALGRMSTGAGDGRVAAGGIPPVPVELPDYAPDRSARLGIGAPVKPESMKKFQDAMAFSGTAGFTANALPLLREAVALDATNDQAQFWLGVVLLRNDKGTAAVRPLEEAVRLAPKSTLYKQYLLFAYLRTGHVAKALVLQSELLKRP